MARKFEFIRCLFLVTVFISSLLFGCASMSGMKSESLEKGKNWEYSASYSKVLDATRKAVSASGLAIENVQVIDNNTTAIYAKKGASAFSWGELVRIVVKKISDEKTDVRVITKRKLATNITAKGDYADTIFSNITLVLE